ncbi:WD40-repeat-containing domain protein [Earliella scabrosa]|nr:WD40-repeat-containing domain protein [Earliella scabrosa]
MSEFSYVQTAHLADGHSKGVTSVVFSTDGSLLASSGLDGAVCIWDTKTWSLLDVYYAKTRVTALAWFTDQALVCGLEDGILSSLARDDGNLRVSGFYAHRFAVEHLSVSGDLVATGAQEDVGIWSWDIDAARACLFRSLPLPQVGDHLLEKVGADRKPEVLVTGVFWTSTYLIVTYLHHGIRFYSRQNWKLVSVIHAESNIINGSLSPNGAFLAATTLVGTFDIYDLNAGKVIRTFVHDEGGHECAIPVVFIHGGHAIVCGSIGGRVSIWFVDSGRKLPSLLVPNDEKVLAIAGYYDADLDRFVVATGLMNEQTKSSIIIWTAASTNKERPEGEELPASVDVAERTTTTGPLLKKALGYMLFGAIIIYAFAYAIFMDDDGLGDFGGFGYSHAGLGDV